MSAVLGIDPGAHGAIAVFDGGELFTIIDMPVTAEANGRTATNAPLLAGILARTHAREAFCEFVGPRPTDGSVQAFAFGRCRGAIEGVVAALSIQIDFITPPAWKRLVGIPPGKDGAKDAARSEAIRRWPDKAAWFARVKDDGRAEASLIAVAGLMRRRA